MSVVWDREAVRLSSKLVDEFEQTLDRHSAALAEEDGRVEIGTGDVVGAFRWLADTDWAAETLEKFGPAGTNGDARDG